MDKLKALLLQQESGGLGKPTGQEPVPPQTNYIGNGRSHPQQTPPSSYRGQMHQQPRSNPGQTQQPPVYGQNTNFDYHNWQQMMMPP
ncbi:unnamed protein product, partial [Allacma fusca]